MEKIDLFIDWLCGKTDRFPFFKDMPKVKYPTMGKTKSKMMDLENNCHHKNKCYDQDGDYICAECGEVLNEEIPEKYQNPSLDDDIYN